MATPNDTYSRRNRMDLNLMEPAEKNDGRGCLGNRKAWGK